ncbi:MAG: chloride channel protein [Planctomycetia bacterium]|nr:chloride channel protein [Planctomycetia bacterium]
MKNDIEKDILPQDHADSVFDPDPHREDPLLHEGSSPQKYKFSEKISDWHNQEAFWKDVSHVVVEKAERKTKSASGYLLSFLKWIIIAGIVGLFSGGVGTLFQVSVFYSTQFRLSHDKIILLLPFGGLLIVALYHLAGIRMSYGTNELINAVHTGKKITVLLAPLIFLGTVITHLMGGSAGRESAALQLGGCLGVRIGRFLRLNPDDMRLMVLCGMSGVFTALFGTPVTSTFFSMEIASVGVMYYPCFVPCLISSLVSYTFALRCGAVPTRFVLENIPILNEISVFQVVCIAIITALISILFCVSITRIPEKVGKICKNEYWRVFIGGTLIVLFTFMIGTRDYNGMGSAVIRSALHGSVSGDAFIWKFLFTMLTFAAGFKGGAIVPAFFIGSALGAASGSLIGLDPGFSAAVGLVAMFCSAVNCPAAALVLSVELFGSQALVLFSVACGVSYMLSGYYSLFTSQNILYSKLKAEFINIHAK